MNIQHLRYAVEVEKTGSISHAADNLYMNQPNLSKAIKELETSLGVELFDRSSKGVVPTAKGREFLLYARNVLAQIDRMTALCREDSTSQTSLRISVPRSSFIAAAFADFVNSLDGDNGLDIRFLETNSIRVIRNITDEGFTLGIIRYSLEHEPYFLNYLAEKALSYEVLWSFDCKLLTSRHSPLAEMEELHVSQLEDYIQVMHGDLLVPYLYRREAQQALDSRSKRIHVYERGSQLDLLAQVPNSYLWTAPMPGEALERYGLVLKPCRGLEQTYRDVLIAPKGYQLTPAEKSLIQHIKNTWLAIQW